MVTRTLFRQPLTRIGDRWICCLVVCLYAGRLIGPFVDLFICLAVHLPMFICPSSVHLPICSPARLSMCLSVHTPVCSSACGLLI